MRNSTAQFTIFSMGVTLLWIVYSTAFVYSSVFYGFLVRQLLSSASPPTGAGSEERPPVGVSVIVCAHNEYQNLTALLPLLFQQKFAPFEIVVAVDTSDDGSYEFLTTQQQTNPQLNIVRIEQRPPDMQAKKYALTQAIRAARYDQLLLTDADCRPVSPDWLRLMTQPLSGATQFVLGYSPYVARRGWLNRFIRYETLHTGFLYTAAALAGYPYMGVGRNLAYRKLFFLHHGGFQNHRRVVGGDDDLWVNQHATKNNVAVVLAKESLVYSFPKVRWLDYYHQKKRHLHVGQHYRRRDKLALGLLSLSTITFWVTGLSLMFLCNKCYGIVALFLLRWLILAAVFGTARRRLHDPINLWLLPILDALHVMYYVVIGSLAFSTKNIRWTS